MSHGNVFYSNILSFFCQLYPFLILPFSTSNLWNFQEIEASNPKILELANQNTSASVKFETLIKFGSPAQSIISLAKDETFNLIVVGSRGLSGLSEFLLGSVSNKISHAATIPVLIVK